MSRIGKLPIAIPDGVKVEVEDAVCRVTGPKGTLSETIPAPITVRTEDGRIVVERPNDEGRVRALHGLTRALVANMVEGVTQGYRRVLCLHGVGYRAQVQGSKLVLSLGFSHPVEIHPPEGVTVAAEPSTPTMDNQYLAARIVVEGIDKQAVGQITAKIRAQRKPEPYKGKGIRYEGEVVRRKAGKAAVATGR
jgi:large subunit ribosomal protein L6